MGKEQDLLFNVADIVKRAKQVLNFKTGAEPAAYLGVSRSMLSNWSARNSIGFPLLLEKLEEVDYNWLLVGKRPVRAGGGYTSLGRSPKDLQVIFSTLTSHTFTLRTAGSLYLNSQSTYCCMMMSSMFRFSSMSSMKRTLPRHITLRDFML